MGFKVGDRVTWSQRPEFGVGTVVPDPEWRNGAPDHVSVRFDGYNGYNDSDGPDSHGPEVRDLTLVSESDATKPNYYEFPGGVQPLDLSQHLTHAGGSALDYIARACRADGVFKSDRIEDLEKAKVWIDVEIARLRHAVERD